MRLAIALLASALLCVACGRDDVTAPASKAPIRSVSAVQDGDTVRVSFEVNQPFRVATLWIRFPPWSQVLTIDDRAPRRFAFAWTDYYEPGSYAWYSVRIEWGAVDDPQFYAVYDFVRLSGAP